LTKTKYKTIIKIEPKSVFNKCPFTIRLAPIAVEILLCRGSAQKIGTDSGIGFKKKYKLKVLLDLRPTTYNL
jgi:hypothetical protein